MFNNQELIMNAKEIKGLESRQKFVLMCLLFGNDIGTNKLYLNRKFTDGVVELSVEKNSAICPGLSLNLKARKDGFSDVQYLAGWDLKNHKNIATRLIAEDLEVFADNIIGALKKFNLVNNWVFSNIEFLPAGCSEDEAQSYSISIGNALAIRIHNAETSEEIEHHYFSTAGYLGLDFSREYFGLTKEAAFTKVGDYTVLQHVCDALEQVDLD